jgi:hypothetical protein
MAIVAVTEIKSMTRMIKNDRADDITLIESSRGVDFLAYNGTLADGDLVLHIT